MTDCWCLYLYIQLHTGGFIHASSEIGAHMHIYVTVGPCMLINAFMVMCVCVFVCSLIISTANAHLWFSNHFFFFLSSSLQRGTWRELGGFKHMSFN